MNLRIMNLESRTQILVSFSVKQENITCYWNFYKSLNSLGRTNLWDLNERSLNVGEKVNRRKLYNCGYFKIVLVTIVSMFLKLVFYLVHYETITNYNVDTSTLFCFKVV